MRRSALLLVLLPLVVSGCGGGEPSEPSASSEPAGTASPDAGPRVLDASKCRDAASREENPGSCYAAWTPLDDEPVLVARGTGFELADQEDPDSRETMTVEGADCGLAELPGAVPERKPDGSDDPSRTRAVRADPGMTFCRVTATWQNTGTKPLAGWTDFGDLIAADGTVHAADEKAAAATQQLNECSPYSCGTIEPNAPALDVVTIYQVPEGTEPASVRWSPANTSSGPVVEFLVE